VTRWFRGSTALLALMVAVAGCMGADDPRRPSTDACLRPAVGPAGGAQRAMVALLSGGRLLRISLPSGAAETRRTLDLGPRVSPADERDAFRLDAPAGPTLATAEHGRAVVALVRRPASEGDRVAVLDARTLRLRCSHALARGVRYNGLVLGRSGRFYAVGNRSTGIRGRWNAVLTIGDVRTGALQRTRTLRAAAGPGEPAQGAKDWYVYWAALSADERRLVVSYHGGDTTGGDWYRVSGRLDLSAGAAREQPGRTDIGWLHGAVEPVGAGFVGTTGRNEVLLLDRRAREIGRMPVRGVGNHLMDFALDPERRRAYFSLCGRRPTINRLDLARDRQERFRSGSFCGRPLAVHDDRFVLLDATPVSRRGYPRTVESELRLFDLVGAGASRPIAGSSGALDAVVVR
jgi:hypothetical protein